MAIAFQSVLIGWEVYLLTESKLMLGFIGLTEAIPAIGLALYGGHVADKSEKKRLFFLMLSFLYSFKCNAYFINTPRFY